MAHSYHFVALVGLMLRFSLDSGPAKSKSPKEMDQASEFASTSKA